MNQSLSPEEQRLIIEKLYRSDDSITSTERFNKAYSDQIGKFGKITMPLNDFGRKMKQTDFTSQEVERFTKEVSGKTIDLETL
ncbi:MAG: hypothetical protein Q8O32_03915 [bacterium]|nr:hypothetical protein [bacterium]